MSTMASQITRLTMVYSTVYLGVDQKKHQSSASLGLVRGIHRWPVNSPHKGPVTRKIFPVYDIDKLIRDKMSLQIEANDSLAATFVAWNGKKQSPHLVQDLHKWTARKAPIDWK